MRTFLLLIFLTFSSFSMAQEETINVTVNDSYDKLWQQVDYYTKEDLPKSADAVLSIIMDKANQTGDFQHLTKAVLKKAECRMDISTDSIIVDIKQMECLFSKPVVNSGKDKDAKTAILHVIMASVYRSVNYSSLSRSNDDMKAECIAKIKEHIEAALKNKSNLAGVTATPYYYLYNKGDDSRLFNNDVLSLLLYYIERNGMMSVYEEPQETMLAHLRQTLDLYKGMNLRNAAVLVQMKIWEKENNLERYSMRLSSSDYRDNLKALYEANTDIEAGADAFMAYYDKNYFDNKGERKQLLQWAVSKWGDTSYGKTLKAMEKQLHDKKVNLDVEGHVIAGREFKICVYHENVKTMKVRVIDKNKKTILERTINDDFGDPSLVAEDTKTDTIFTTLKPGKYTVSVEAEGKKEQETLRVSSLKLLSYHLPDKGTVVAVVNALTGMPEKKCKVVVGDREWDSDKSEYVMRDSTIMYSDNNGLVYVNNENYSTAYAAKDKDDISNNCSLATGENYRDYDYVDKSFCDLFTDRAIYKPGQTVYVTGYIYDREGDKYRVRPGASDKLTLKDANGQTVDEKNVRADDFGMFTESFVIPKHLLNGTFSIRCEKGGSVNIRVEEYKRPTFDIKYEEQEGKLSFGDTITVTGVATTYSGVPVQGAKVDVKVEARSGKFWTYWRSVSGSWKQVEVLETETDDEGKFKVKVFLDGDRAKDETLNEWRKYFSGVMFYKVSAKVTDMGGESHEKENVLAVSEYEYNVQIVCPNNLNQDKYEEITVNAVNANNKKVDAHGTWTLKRFNRVDGKNDYVETSLSGEFDANKPFTITELKNLPLGKYRLRVESIDGKGHKCHDSTDFVLFSTSSKPIVLEDDWIYSDNRFITDGEGLDIYYAVECDRPFVYAYLISADNVEKQRLEIINDKVQHLHIDYKDAYKKGLAFFLVYVKNDEEHNISKSFEYVKPDKHLDISWTTFRDKLTPGQEETWTLNIKDKNGKPVQAQMLAAMYDASLDAIAPHHWSFYLSFSRNVPYMSAYSSVSGTGYINKYLDFKTTSIPGFQRKYNMLIGFDRYYGFSRYDDYDEMVLMDAAVPMAMVNVSARKAETAALKANYEMADEVTEEELVSKNDETQDNDAPAVKLRSDFTETAFFYPDLIPDKDGNVNISFRLPESLTEWKFLGFAHTKDMDNGLIRATAMARKEFMVQPNMPRFVRTGDKATITAKIINQAEADVAGKAVMRLLNPDNEEVVYKQELPFDVAAGKSSAVTFAYDIDDKYNMLICEISAAGNNFSDGERNWLPILSDKKFITETVPFYIQGEGTKDVDISTLFNNNSPSATNRKMVFDYTDNPTWNVVLSMHAVMNPKDDDAISWASALYSNMVIRHLAKRMPRLTNLIQQWENETGNETTLQGELEKNQELKDIILQEAPWMMEAQQETVYKQQLSELFNENLLNSRIEKARHKLKDLQLSDGAWTWFKGMQPSYYTTFAVCDNLSMLYDYFIHVDETVDDDINDMLQKGLKYIDGEELKYYEKYMKKEKKDLPGDNTLHYMYMVAISKHDASRATRNMIDDYLDRLKGHTKDFTTYGKANVAIALMAYDRKDEALPYVKSLREYTVSKPGMGRFFDGEKTRYSWCDYRIPSHVATMKAFLATADEFDDSQEYLNDMQIWLLRQKQAQKWNSLVSTINAVDLLLKISPETSFHQEQLPEVKVGGENLDIESQTAGVGFVKVVVPDEFVSRTMSSSKPTVTVTKHSDGISWGTVYGQSLESLDKIEQNGSELTIVRKFFVEISGSWKEVDDNYQYKVGDKVRMRHVITADRDMDFVQVRSQHAACLEPVKVRSGYQSLGGRGGYLALHDASADFFFSTFQKGTVTIDLDMYVTSTGNYSNGIATVQCAYAPTFSGHSKGNRINVK